MHKSDFANRLDRLLSEILTYAKPQTLQLEELELNSWLQTLLNSMIKLPAQRQSINFKSASDALKIMSDRDKLKQVMINILRNACEASPAQEAINCEIEPLDSRRTTSNSVR